MRILHALGVGLLLALAACTATMPYKPATIVQQVSADTGIPASSILQHARCRAGYARPGARDVVMHECVFIRSTAWAAIIGYNAKSKRYFEAMRLNGRLGGVALKTEKTLLAGELKQLQIRDGNSYVVLDFVHPDIGGPGNTEALLATFAALKELGIPEIPGRDFIDAYVRPGPITIYVPAAR